MVLLFTLLFAEGNGIFCCGFDKKEVYYIQFIIPRKTGGIAL